GGSPAPLPPTPPLKRLRRPGPALLTLPPVPLSPLLHRDSPRHRQHPPPSNPQPPHSSLVNKHANPCGLSPPNHLPHGVKPRKDPVRRPVHPALPSLHLFPCATRNHPQVLAPLNSFIRNTYK